MTSVLSPAVEGSYIRLEILLPAATSAVAMAALKVEFYGSVLASLPVTEERMNFFLSFSPILLDVIPVNAVRIAIS